MSFDREASDDRDDSHRPVAMGYNVPQRAKILFEEALAILFGDLNETMGASLPAVNIGGFMINSEAPMIALLLVPVESLGEEG